MEPGTHPSNQRVTRAAASGGVLIEVLRFPAGTRTAVDAAAAVGCPLGAIVKSMVLTTDGGPVVVLTSGTNRVDYAKVATTLSVGNVDRADAQGVRDATGFPIGGTAPFGYPSPLPVLLDRDLLAFEQVWAAGGTPDTVFAITPSDLLRLCDARSADIRVSGEDSARIPDDAKGASR